MKLKKTFFLFFLIVLIPHFTYAITISEIKQNSKDYFFGESVSVDVKEAKDYALQDLLEAIVPVAVESSFESKAMRSQNNAFKSEAKSLLKTYAFEPSLEGVETLLEKNSVGEFVCLKYIKKTEVAKIYSGRKNQIAQFCKFSKRYEKEKNYQDALKFNYYALVLLKTIPPRYLNDKERALSLSIPERINKIIDATSFRLLNIKEISKQEREYLFEVKVLGQDVAKLEISFWDGNQNINIFAKDSRFILPFFGKKETQPKDTRISVVYKQYKDREQFNTLNSAWDYIRLPRYGKPKKVSLTKTEPSPVSVSMKSSLTSSSDIVIVDKEIICENENSCPDKDIKEKITIKTNRFISFLNEGNLSKILTLTNDEFIKKKLSKIIKYNNVKTVNDEEQKIFLNKTQEGWEVRKIPVLNSYASLSLQSIDYLVLDFSKEGELKDLNFTVTQTLYETFKKNSKKVDNWQQVQVLIKFLEKYRTAYLARDIETINKIFSDKALIIVGRIIEKDKVADLDNYKYKKIGKNQPDVEYLRFTKKEYVKRQTQIFKQNKDIHVGFSTFNVLRQNSKSDIYELSMKQYYKSSNYSDEGYLFLLIDFKEKDKPKIYVRAWQPREWNEKNLLSMDNFEICTFK